MNTMNIHDPDNESGNEPIDQLSADMEPCSVEVFRPGRRPNLTVGKFIDLLQAERFDEAAKAMKEQRVTIWTADTARRVIKHQGNIPNEIWNSLLEDSDLVTETL